MPTYSYVNEGKGVCVDRTFSMGKAPKMIDVDGVICALDWSALGGGSRRRLGTIQVKERPQHSVSNGVLPHQIPEAQAMDRRVGAPQIQYDAKGRAVFENRRDKNRWLRAHKRVDRDAGYGDPAPGDFHGQIQVAEE